MCVCTHLKTYLLSSNKSDQICINKLFALDLLEEVVSSKFFFREGYRGVPGIACILAISLPAQRTEFSRAKGRESGVHMGLHKGETRVTNADEGLLQNYNSI